MITKNGTKGGTNGPTRGEIGRETIRGRNNPGEETIQAAKRPGGEGLRKLTLREAKGPAAQIVLTLLLWAKL